jgi:hypothetical protein
MTGKTVRSRWQWLKDHRVGLTLRATDEAASAMAKGDEPFLVNRAFAQLIGKARCVQQRVPGHALRFTVRQGVWTVDGRCSDCPHQSGCVTGQARQLGDRAVAAGLARMARLVRPATAKADVAYVMRAEPVAIEGQPAALVYISETRARPNS